MSASGCLFPYRNLATGETDFEGIRRLLLCYWTGVKETFPKAWGKPPKASRLNGIRTAGEVSENCGRRRVRRPEFTWPWRASRPARFSVQV